MQDDRKSNISTTTSMMQFGAQKGKSATGHKTYLKNMLINRLVKKYPDQDNGDLLRILEGEVNVFIASEYVTKESMRQLEQKVARKLYPQLNSTQNTERRKFQNDQQPRAGTILATSSGLNNSMFELDPMMGPADYQPKNASSVKRKINSKIRLVNQDLPQLKANGQPIVQSRDTKMMNSSSHKSVPRPKNNITMTIDAAARKNPGLLGQQEPRSFVGIRAKHGTTKGIVDETRRQVRDRNENLKVSLSRQSMEDDNHQNGVETLQKQQKSSILMDRMNGGGDLNQQQLAGFTERANSIGINIRASGATRTGNVSQQQS